MNWKQIPQILSRYRNPQGQIPHQGAAPSITYKQKEIYKEKEMEPAKTDEEIRARRALLKAQAAYLLAKYAKKAA